MKLHYGLDSLPHIQNAVVSSGTFDGVHIGHQKILRHIITLAKEINGESVLITFWPHPRLVLHPDDDSLRLLNTFEEKTALLHQLGIDHLIAIQFTPEFSQLTSEQFIQQVLVNKIKTKKLVIGYDHRFGKNREGSFEYLKANADQYGFTVEEIPAQDVEDVTVSSTKIRKALEEGHIQIANEYLGNPYQLTGKVVRGQQIGRTIDFPTANLSVYERYKLVPKNGVYAVQVKCDEQYYRGMLNIGQRPTLNGTDRSIEVHIFDFDQDIYDREITISFFHFIREEQKFANLEALKEQLWQDKKYIQSIFSS